MSMNFQPYEGKAPYIFVSYARKDAERVIPLLDALNLAGYRVWYDKGIQSGKRWADSLAEHIAGCSLFMPLISSAFADSTNCYNETSYANYKKKTIVPVCLEKNVELPSGLEMVLHPIQWRKLSDDSGADEFVKRLETEDAFFPCKPINVERVLSVDSEFSMELITCSDTDGGVEWEFSVADGKLTFRKGSSGEIPNHHKVENPAPWRERFQNDIKTADINPGITCIGEYAFYECRHLSSVTIPDSVTEIKNAAFEECENLTSVIIPNSVTKMGLWAFYHCARLNSVILSENMMEISAATFEGCRLLTHVTIPNGVKIIGKWAFYHCAGLTNVIIPDSALTIGSKAFRDCPSLTCVSVPKNANIAPDAFDSETEVIRR